MLICAAECRSTAPRPGALQHGGALNHGSLAAANRGVAEYELSE